jgi:glycosyltransferase involved in cell wall biosynthesis
MALLEAMAMGKACLCSDLVEIRQLGGEAVVYFPPRDLAGLVAALRALVGDPARRAQLGEVARAAVRGFADPLGAARRFVAAVQEAIEHRR